MGTHSEMKDAYLLQPLESRRLLSFLPFGTVTTVPPDISQVIESAEVAVADNGSFVVVNQFFTPVESAEIGTLSVTAVRYSFDGRQVGAPLTIATRSYNRLTQQILPVSTSIDADGDAVVAYGIETGHLQIEYYFRRISRSGDVSSPVLIAQGYVADLAVSMDRDGRFFVGWVKPHDRLLEMRAYDATGTPRGPAFVAFEDKTASEFREIDVAARPDGSGAVFSFTHVRAQPFVLFGQVNTIELVGEIGFSEGPRGSSTSKSSVATLSDGSFVVGFDEFSPSTINPTGSEGFVQRYNSDGELLGEPIPLGMAQANRGVHAIELDSMSDGGFVAAFQQATPGNVETVYIRRYDASGVPDGAAPVPLARRTGTSDSFDLTSVGSDDNGSTVVLFSERRIVIPPGSNPTTSQSLRFRRVTPQPAAIDKSVLYVLGSDDFEHIEITPRGLSLVVTRNTTIRRFDPALVNSIWAHGYGGNDFIRNNTLLTSLMNGGEGSDILVGGPGRDKLLGAGGGDRIYGGGGGDLLYGQDGDDYLWGEAGNDTLNGGSGIDVLRGEGGNDSLVANDGVMDQLIGQDGRDTALADGGDVLRTIESRRR